MKVFWARFPTPIIPTRRGDSGILIVECGGDLNLSGFCTELCMWLRSLREIFHESECQSGVGFGILMRCR